MSEARYKQLWRAATGGTAEVEVAAVGKAKMHEKQYRRREFLGPIMCFDLIMWEINDQFPTSVGGQLVDRTANSLASTARFACVAGGERYAPINWPCGQPVDRLHYMQEKRHRIRKAVGAD